MKTVLVLTYTLLLALPLSAQQTGTLKVKVDPGRAGVFVDGKYLGPASNFGMTRTYTVAAGEHELKLEEPRYQEIVSKVTIEAGKRSVVSEKMTALPVPKPPFGRIRTHSADKYAAVYINGKYYGHNDEFDNFAQGLLLPPGEYEVRIEPASGTPVVKKVTVVADKTVVVE
ncbi:MAG TPA: PEGA domain-containing protein [Bryobacteraceae bacterium]